MTRSITILIAALTLVSCTEKPPDTGEPPALQEAGAAGEAALRSLIAAAAEEGSVSYWDTVIQSDTNADLVTAFRRYYGLPSDFAVNYSLSSTTALVTRVEQEVSAGRVTMDVGAVASLPWVHEKTRAGQIMHYASPQYPMYQEAFAKNLGRDGYFAFNGAYFFVPMWNADRVEFTGTSWNDVIGAVATGRMSMGDSSNSQTYLANYMGLTLVLGVDYFKRLAQTGPVFLNRSERIASQLATGQDLMTFTGMPTRAFQLNERGANLKFLLPEEGVVLLPQSMFILAEAPHPAAAKLWVDFMLSNTGQTILVEHEALISGRQGFVSPHPVYAPPLESLNIVNIDWENVTTEDMERARTEWLAIFQP